MDRFKFSIINTYKDERPIFERDGNDFLYANLNAMETETVISDRCGKECRVEVTGRVVGHSGLIKKCVVSESITCEKAGTDECVLASDRPDAIASPEVRNGNGERLPLSGAYSFEHEIYGGRLDFSVSDT